MISFPSLNSSLRSRALRNEINLSIVKYFIATSSMIASITRLRIWKVICWTESHKKRVKAVSAHKLHNIVQSIEFYWLNSPLNQLQILYRLRILQCAKWRKIATTCRRAVRSRQKIVERGKNRFSLVHK